MSRIRVAASEVETPSRGRRICSPQANQAREVPRRTVFEQRDERGEARVGAPARPRRAAQVGVTT